MYCACYLLTTIGQLYLRLPLCKPPSLFLIFCNQCNCHTISHKPVPNSSKTGYYSNFIQLLFGYMHLQQSKSQLQVIGTGNYFTDSKTEVAFKHHSSQDGSHTFPIFTVFSTITTYRRRVVSTACLTTLAAFCCIIFPTT